MTNAAPHRSPQEIIEELGIEEPSDLDIDAVAAYCGAYVTYEPLSGADARIVGGEKKAFITVNATVTRARQRFSAAHELGHWMWDRGKMAFACTEDQQIRSWFRNDRETRANEFAADLLMPVGLFRKYSSRREISFNTARDLADLFETSLTSTAIRLVQYGSFPSMVLCFSPTGREWFAASKEIERALWPVKQLDEYSFAHDLLRGKARTSSGEVDADAWINHPRAEDFTVREDSVLVGNERVLTLLWWKDQRMISALT